MYLKSAKITLSVCVGNFVCDVSYIVESLSVLSLCMFKTGSSLNGGPPPPAPPSAWSLLFVVLGER